MIPNFLRFFDLHNWSVPVTATIHVYFSICHPVLQSSTYQFSLPERIDYALFISVIPEHSPVLCTST